MTPSMQKWKKKKRKSKAQQKNEMAKLHEDLVKLLTKRAIEFVKNKSLFEVHGSVVTTHAFTSFPHPDSSERSFSASRSSDVPEFLPFRKHSDYIADIMEAQLLASQKQNSFTGSVIQKGDISSTVDSNVNFSSGFSSVPHASTHVTNNHHEVNDVKASQILPEDLHSTSSKEYNRQPLTLSVDDVFNQSTTHPKKNLNNHTFLNFQSNLEKFKAELEMALRIQTSSNASSVHVWDNDMVSEFDFTGSKEIEDQQIKKVSGKGIRTKRLKTNSQPSSNLKLTDANLQEEIESFRAELSEMDIHLQEWDPYSCGTSMIDAANVSERFSDNFGVDAEYNQYNTEFTSDLPTNSIEFTKNSDRLAAGKQNNLSSYFEKQHSLSSMNLVSSPEKLLQQVSRSPKKAKGKQIDISTPNQILGVPRPKNIETNKKLGHVNVNRELQEMTDKSFVNVSCFTNSEMVAVRNLQYQASRQKYTSVEVFNKLIHALAKKKNLQTIKSLFVMMKRQELPPTLQTYAGCLECIGRMTDPDIQTCKNILQDINKKELELKEIANTCSFELDEFDYILKAIRYVDPDFVPNPPKLVSEYDYELLTALNVVNEQRMERNQYAMDISSEEFRTRARAQLEMEKLGEVVVKSISSSQVQENQDLKMRNLRNGLLEKWRQVLLKSFKLKLEMYKKKAHDNVTMTLYPYLKLFPPEEYVNIIFKFLKELLSSSEGYSPTQAMIQSNLGRTVNQKYNTQSKIAAGMGEKMLKLHELYMETYLNKDYTLDNHRLMWLRAMNQNYDTINMDMSVRLWPPHIQKQIGRFLLEMILYDLKVDANIFRSRAQERIVPAFCSIVRPDVSFFTATEIKMHPVVTKLFNVDNTESFTFDPSTVPMIIPPVPWISKNMGGLLLGSHALVRKGPDLGYIDVLKTVSEKQYPAVLDSLNTLSACAWKMNQPILDLQIEIFNNKGDARLKVASPVSELPPMPVITEDMESKDKALLYRQRMYLQQQKQDTYSLWCTDLYRLSIANKFRDEMFWFPHSMDFRGRTYPLPPHFNHLGSDNVRSMLLFAKGKPLGKYGYDWLKIHLVNLTGFKKRCSNTERLEHAHTIMKEILDSADRPLTGCKWWQTSDEPWQTLACCMEIAKIERFDGNKEDYICHFPVHQDGSCNGLQHYAALGRDQAGAESVNLHPFDYPKDVYSDVVELVDKTRRRDAEQGNETAQALEGFIKRKVIKQTIMTTVYGVTKFGAKLQIHRQLKDIAEFPQDLAWKASLYLTDTTFSCLREMFTATKDIQDWLTESARLISTGTPVEWVTPLGFPVLQPYFKRLSKAESKHDKFKPNIMKQKNAFPPNYIHSLDSSHMMLTSLYCMHAGVTFVSVHDCYWTHACDVSIMNKICREQFVNMHKQPLLEDLSEHLKSVVERATKDLNLQADMNKVDIHLLLSMLNNVPTRGLFDLDNVLKSTYFFS